MPVRTPGIAVRSKGARVSEYRRSKGRLAPCCRAGGPAYLNDILLSEGAKYADSTKATVALASFAPNKKVEVRGAWVAASA